MASAREVVDAYWAAAEARDWDSFGALVRDDVLYESPEGRERVRGREAYLRFNSEGFATDWHLTVERIIAAGSEAATLIRMRYPDGREQHGISFFELDENNLIARITDFWPVRYEIPASRAHLVERY